MEDLTAADAKAVAEAILTGESLDSAMLEV